MSRSRRRRSILEGLPTLVLLGLLAGAIGGVGMGLIQSRSASSTTSISSTTK
jgi:hypothetical protein